MSGILDRIDSVIDGLCPCGAPPRDGSTYCGEDCVPTWRGEHTISDVDGTAMRWRPELLLADFDDDTLVEIAHFPLGRNHATIYERTGSDRLHLRLDDGYRFVGTDVAPDQAGPADVEPGFRAELDPIWERLERELGNTDHLDEDPWDNVMAEYRRILDRLVVVPSVIDRFAEAARVAAAGMRQAGEIRIGSPDPAGSLVIQFDNSRLNNTMRAHRTAMLMNYRTAMLMTPVIPSRSVIHGITAT